MGFQVSGVYKKEKGAVKLELSSCLSSKLSVSTAIHFWLARLHLNSGNKNGVALDRGSGDRAGDSGFSPLIDSSPYHSTIKADRRAFSYFVVTDHSLKGSKQSEDVYDSTHKDATHRRRPINLGLNFRRIG